MPNFVHIFYCCTYNKLQGQCTFDRQQTGKCLRRVTIDVTAESVTVGSFEII